MFMGVALPKNANDRLRIIPWMPMAIPPSAANFRELLGQDFRGPEKKGMKRREQKATTETMTTMKGMGPIS